MRYGYINNYWDESYELLSPLSLTRINIATSGFSTFVVTGNLNQLNSWLKKNGTVNLSLNDPFNSSTTAPSTFTIELRRQFSFFLSPFQLVIRPTLSVDLTGTPRSSHPSLNEHFRFPMYKKLIIGRKVTLSELAEFIEMARSSSHTLHALATPVPVSVYQVGRARLNVGQFELVSQNCRRVSDRMIRLPRHAPAYSASDYELYLPPTYTESEASHPPLPRYSTQSSLPFPNPNLSSPVICL